MSRSVHIVALAARTPVGATAASSAAAVRAGISRITEHPFMVDSLGDPLRAGRVLGLDPALLGWRRIAALAEHAMDELCQQLAALGLGGGRLPMLFGLPEARPGWTDQHAAATLARLAEHERARAFGLAFEPVARGHAAAIHGIGVAFERIRTGEADCCVVGGVDSYFDGDTLDWMAKHRQIKTEQTRAASFPGEAAGFVVLAGGDLVRALRLESLAELVGVGGARELALIKTDDINLGRGLAAAVAAACAPVFSDGGRVEDVYCDINGERYRSEEWGMALLKIQDRVVDGSAYHLPVSAWGDIGAASGALFATLAVRAWARGYARGVTALIWAGSESGLRSAAVLRRPNGGARV